MIRCPEELKASAITVVRLLVQRNFSPQRIEIGDTVPAPLLREYHHPEAASCAFRVGQSPTSRELVRANPQISLRSPSISTWVNQRKCECSICNVGARQHIHSLLNSRQLHFDSSSKHTI